MLVVYSLLWLISSSISSASSSADPDSDVTINEDYVEASLMLQFN